MLSSVVTVFHVRVQRYKNKKLRPRYVFSIMQQQIFNCFNWYLSLFEWGSGNILPFRKADILADIEI